MKKGFLKKNVTENVKVKEKINKEDLRLPKVDRLSVLPKVLLHHILSFLDIKEVLRTCILSRRWRYLWIDLHVLNIDDKFWLDINGEVKTDKFQTYVNKFLLQRDGSNIEKFSLIYENEKSGYVVDDYMDKIYTWVVSVVRRNVEDLHLQVQYMPPLFSFCYSTKLKTLRLTNATLPVQVEGSWCPPSLESLIIENCCHQYLEDINISALQLKYLKVINKHDSIFVGPYQCELKICAPNLTSLECIGYMYQNYHLENLSSVVFARIDTKKYRDHNTKTFLVMALKNLFRGLTFADLQTLFKPVVISFPNLKYLKLTEWRHDCFISTLAKLFEGFSCIETLVMERMKVSYKPPKQEVHWGKQLVFNCMLHKLKSVRMQNLKGCENELRFIEVLLEKAMVLEDIAITTTKEHTSDSEKKLEEFIKKLQSLPKASSSATILCN
ncbi:hypothetical protein AQUCO_03500127v1 [Aquilegia coerulea]|uniref:F-box domain-containing protein n=1 Tax=Aquilegia coerulea TaxID=218851 RepID=A0A2G5CWA7_AQUCA|nr:hypothetical protein AQUCO_03500127v1 [Aquilegia coerulea]